MPAAGAAVVHVVIESGAKHVFVSALEWPGWARSGRDEPLALETLAAYTERYRSVARIAGVRFPAHPAFEVVERLPGNATTDFGAPGRPADAERGAPGPADARRLAALVRAAWDTLDAVSVSAPASLRKGPRGGGRDRDQVVAHVLGAEHSYARTIGVRLAEPAPGDHAAIEACRAAILDAIRASARRDAAATSWPARYAARRIAWHVLDHAWEIEDKSGG